MTNSAAEFDVFKHYGWSRAYADTKSCAIFKQQPEDFQVFERELESPSSQGEHLWLEIEKTACNTGWVAEQLAAYFNIKPQDVGFAGRKDRHAITRQAMSLYLPKQPHAKIENTPFSGVTVLRQSRHHKKIRTGDLAGNQFKICLREFTGDKQAVIDNLEQIKEYGVPNYFGAQRFGHFAHNIQQARQMLDDKQALSLANKKPRRVKNQGIYLSALRSFVFNQLVSQRIQQESWQTLTQQPNPTAALWGRGIPTTESAELELEQNYGTLHPKDCSRLEHSGLNQERRKLIAKVHELDYSFNAQHLKLNFYLEAGQYATSVLREVLTTQQAMRP